jgi:hypothetical protein
MKAREMKTLKIGGLKPQMGKPEQTKQRFSEARVVALNRHGRKSLRANTLLMLEYLDGTIQLGRRAKSRRILIGH